MKYLASAVFLIFLGARAWAGNDVVKIGLNYDATGTYQVQGLDQLQAARMAADEINAAGGILGRKIELVLKDAAANASLSVTNATDLIEKDHVQMIFGGVASSVAIAVGKVANAHRIPFFGTLTYSTETTGVDGRKFVFRECYDSFAAARVLAGYMNSHYAGKKFFYITARYTWGYTTEDSFRNLTHTEDRSAHKRAYTPFPNAKPEDFDAAIAEAVKEKPDVLVLVLFGQDMVDTLKKVYAQGLKSKMAVIVPNLTLGMAEGAGPEAMEGVVGAEPWDWKIPYKYDFKRGQKFVEDFVKRYSRYPSTSGASAYTILYEYKNAVERAKSFDGPAVVKALEGHRYALLKDEQYWRDFDHQSIQTVYAVKGRPAAEVKKSKFAQDYFDFISTMKGEEAFIDRAAWLEARKRAGRPLELD